MDTTTATAARIEATRIAKGVSRLALSEKSGIPRTTLNRMLEGKQPFHINHIEFIATALAVDPKSLVEFRAVA